MKIALIHGHGASADSFNFLRSELDAEFIALEYDSKDGFAANLADMALQLEDEPRVFFVAHSLGGLYALHLSEQLGARALGAVTMATPYAGSEVALALNMFCPSQIYRDIHPTAAPITQGRDIKPHGPWTAIISTKGHSQLMAAANDGIVSRDSMYSRRGARFIEVESNHHEVTQSRRSVEIIRAALLEVAA
jgi:pimeloyl-ACP methyl ester carboxylesterase